MKIAKHKSREAPSAPMPERIKPMLCTLLNEPFDNKDYVFEVKWDGYRVIAYKSHDEVRLDSRGGLSFNKKYPSILSSLRKLGHDLVLDGEIVVLNENGKPDFDALQKFNGGKNGVIFYVFDLLWCDGIDYKDQPLLDRKKVLKEILEGNDVLRYSDHFEDGRLLFQQVQALQLEGIVAKEKTSKYLPDKRGKQWYKIPTALKQEFVIGGWVESESGRLFRTLLFGAYNNKGKLEWIGHAGGGFKDHEMPAIHSKLKVLESDQSPFENHVDYDGVVHWVKPELVANIKYATTTRSGKIRKPAIFLGFREDKPARDVRKEVPAHVSEEPARQQSRKDRQPVKTRPNRILQPAAESNWKEVDKEKINHREVLDLEDCKVEVYNVQREIWKGISKGHLLQYYHSISRYILPHLRDRPLSLYLKLKGAFAAGVYIKDMEGRAPTCSEVFPVERKHKKEGKRDVIDYLVCNNVSTLLYMVNLGCVDINPWASRTVCPDKPDYIIIDLDPSDNEFHKAISAAVVAKDIFDRQRIKAFIKTSGKTGLHIYVPCTAFTFGESRTIAENICGEIHSQLQAITTTEISIDQRGDKLFLDPNQNDFTDTVAAPYSVRPHRHPTVSTPLTWKELTDNLDPEAFTIQNTLKRLEKKGDVFQSVLDKAIALKNDAQLKKIL